jgi:hypothetical protein
VQKRSSGEQQPIQPRQKDSESGLLEMGVVRDKCNVQPNVVDRPCENFDCVTRQKLTGTCFGPVRSERGPNVFENFPAPLNLELDHRSGSAQAPNFELNHGPVRVGSGSNHGSEPNLTIPIRTYKPYRVPPWAPQLSCSKHPETEVSRALYLCTITHTHIA